MFSCLHIWLYLSFQLIATCLEVHSTQTQSVLPTYYANQPIDDFIIISNEIIVGEVNGVVALELGSLRETRRLTTGPVNDSIDCSVDGLQCLQSAKLELTENHCRLLTTLPQGILFCGSVRQGSCALLSRTGPLTVLSNISLPVAALSSPTLSINLPPNLFVAAPPSQDSIYRDPFPVFSLRQLPNLAILNSGSLDGESAVYLRASHRRSVTYLSTFTHAHFVYILSLHYIRSHHTSTITKLIRVCKNDTRFTSYSEIELQCRAGDNSNYPVATAAYLHGNNLIVSFASGSKSVLCVYAMTKIKLTFWYNVDRCRGGTGSIGLPHIGRDTKCTKKSTVLDEDSCEFGVGGSIEAVEVAEKTVEGRVTALQGMKNPNTVFAGLEQGQVILMKWQDPNKLEEYGRREVGDSKMGTKIRKMLLDGTALIIQLEKGINRMEIHSCSQLSSCADCLSTADPFCSWCLPLGKCTPAVNCPVQPSEQCPLIPLDSLPKTLSVDEPINISLGVNSLPRPKGFSYICQIGSYNVTASWSTKSLSCTSPALPLRVHTHQLSLMTSLSTVPIMSYQFDVYNCSAFATCSQCASFPTCNWCPTTFSCVRNGVCDKTPSFDCVRLSPPPLLASSNSVTVVLPAAHLESLRPSNDYWCKLEVPGLTHTVRASISSPNSSIVCEPFALPIQPPNASVPLQFGEANHLIDETKVTFYQCSSLASDCSTCISLNPSLHCSWCEGRCSYNCTKASEKVICDRPKILKFSPKSGPLDGGTLVEIEGRDLGTSIEDVKDRVYVAGSKCTVEEYIISRHIKCRVDKGTSSGPIRVTVGRSSTQTAESTQFYSFLPVSIYSAYPLFGPYIGGVQLTLFGENLHIGSNASVRIGDGECTHVRRNVSSLRCFLPPASNSVSSASLRLLLSIDATTVPFDSFRYTENPTISSIQPAAAFVSGGNLLIFQGLHFDSLSTLQLFLISSESKEPASHPSVCSIMNATLLHCPSPRLLHMSSRYSRYIVAFSLGNATLVPKPHLRLSILPDPQFKPFEGIRRHQPKHPLILQGSHLNSALPEDYKIFVGGERCFVSVIDSQQLVCSPPDEQPKPLTDDPYPSVVVIVGNMEQQLGLIYYDKESSFISSIYPWLIFILTMILSACAFAFYMRNRRRAEKDRHYRKIQMKMENLEVNVRNECKQAFAELQTSMGVVGSPDVSSQKATPLLPFSLFIHRLLFPDGLLPLSPSFSNTLPLTLAQFHSLLLNKEFVLSLIRTADSDTSLTPSDRSFLASLILSVILRNYAYCSDIVLTLLRKHIGDTVRANKSALLFRTSESLVESLIAKWLTVSLYPHMLPQFHSLYSLCMALKYQTEQGPVDAVTGNAKYTINESNLLRETIDTKQLECEIRDDEGRCGRVRLNDCDSVGQIKEKTLDSLYKGIGYSQRHREWEIELEWYRCSDNQSMILHDVDEEDDAKPKRICTAKAYCIQSGDLLVARERRNGESPNDSGRCSYSSVTGTSHSRRYPASTYYHLTMPTSQITLDRRRKLEETIPNSIPEVYLTRLLTSKGTVQKYIDDFLNSILSEAETPQLLKHVFDLLDEEAQRYSICETMCRQWKANCLILRVWLSLISTPSLLFDIQLSPALSANMLTVAQTLTHSLNNPNKI
ncbi:hypothetical protein WR25_21348 [Diploscapter pachys]|uniref:Sema domain-containing protein n=1 Tax=Diploscapter pachys TaxID=2018661 RepID=A0A2A2KQN8_9BILA|nr:hypothetical protein WR25_21348 [Diploscapter pachys]